MSRTPLEEDPYLSLYDGPDSGYDNDDRRDRRSPTSLGDPLSLKSTIGQPGVARGRSDAGGIGTHNPLVPHDTEHTIWDEIDETMGVPWSYSQSDRGSQLGSTVPGANGQTWGRAHLNPSDEDDRDRMMRKFGKSERKKVLDSEPEPVRMVGRTCGMPTGLGSERIPPRDVQGAPKVVGISAWTILSKIIDGLKRP